MSCTGGKSTKKINKANNLKQPTNTLLIVKEMLNQYINK
jgi:hypothetical protein